MPEWAAIPEVVTLMARLPLRAVFRTPPSRGGSSTRTKAAWAAAASIRALDVVLPTSSSAIASNVIGRGGRAAICYRARKIYSMTTMLVFMSKIPGPKAVPASLRNG